MLAMLVEKGRISSADVKTGLVDLIEFIDSYVYDAPKAFDYLGDILSTMIKVKAIDMAWICEQAEKTKLSSAENPERILKSLAGSLKTVLGEDEAKSVLGIGTIFIEKLVGTDKCAAIKNI